MNWLPRFRFLLYLVVGGGADFGHAHGGRVAADVQALSWGSLGDEASARGTFFAACAVSC